MIQYSPHLGSQVPLCERLPDEPHSLVQNFVPAELVQGQAKFSGAAQSRFRYAHVCRNSRVGGFGGRNCQFHDSLKKRLMSSVRN